MENKKILFIYSDRIHSNDLPWALLRLGYDVVSYEDDITMETYVLEEKVKLRDYLKRNDFPIALSYDFIPTVSDACEESKVKYVAWVYDSPQMNLYTQAVYNTYNYIFVFDRKQMERLEKLGRIKHLYHYPLGTNVERVSALVITEEDEQKYISDISFVGGLYEENSYNRNVHYFPEEIRKSVDVVLSKCVVNWNETVFGHLTEKEYSFFEKNYYREDWIGLDLPYYMDMQFLSRKLTEMERVRVLNLLAKKWQVRLYSGSHCDELQGVERCGRLDFETEVPKVYFLSRINLNITLRSIETGVPKRVFDIMAAGGFVMSNYQKEIEKIFISDKEIVLFRNEVELMDKTAYYLTHEKERLEIAIAGYKKVRDYYNDQVRLKELLETVEKE